MFDVPSFIPDGVCLSCDGCCRFESEKSNWRAKVYIDEVYKWRWESNGLAQKIFEKDTIDENGYIATKPGCSSCQCKFLNGENNHCQVYTDRPLECAIYPFILRIKNDQPVVSIHLTCPFIQDQYGKESFKQTIEKMRGFFNQPDVMAFVRNNTTSLHHYDEWESELADVFSLNVSSDNDGQAVELLNQRYKMEFSALKQPPELASNSLTALFSWQDFFRFDIQKMNGAICVFAHNELGCFMSFPPVGSDLTPELIAGCFDEMDRHNQQKSYGRIESVTEGQLKHFSGDKYIAEKKGEECCYLREDIAGLKGNEYKSKRSAANQFVKNNDHRYVPYTQEMFDDCGLLYDRWASQRLKGSVDDIYRHMIEENRQVHRRTLSHAKELGLLGRVVYAGGQLSAYTFGYALSPDVFCVLFEIADLEIKGLPTFIFREFCADPDIQSYRFINVMDSFALDNVEKTKLSFRPSHMVQSYTISRKES